MTLVNSFINSLIVYYNKYVDVAQSTLAGLHRKTNTG